MGDGMSIDIVSTLLGFMVYVHSNFNSVDVFLSSRYIESRPFGEHTYTGIF